MDNYGSITGQLNLGTGVNSVNNHQGAVFTAGPKLLIGGPKSVFTNDGILFIGNSDATQTTTLDGSFVQTPNGITWAKLDLGANTIDQISMTGTASLAGQLDLSLLNPQLIHIGSFKMPVFMAAEGVTNNGMVLNTPPSVVLQYSLAYPDNETAAVNYTADFVVKGLSPNLLELGHYFDRIQMAGSSAPMANMVTALVYAPNLTVYRTMLQQVTPDFYGELQSGVILSEERFAQLLNEGGAMQYGSKRGKVWFDLGYENLQHNGEGDYKSVAQIMRREAVGFQLQLGEHWTAGVAGSWGFILRLATARSGQPAATRRKSAVWPRAASGGWSSPAPFRGERTAFRRSGAVYCLMGRMATPRLPSPPR